MHSSSLPRFNPRTPCGVRLFRKVKFKTPEVFQSTHSLRSATGKLSIISFHIMGFNPRTPCGVRPFNNAESETSEPVSIHALLAECDQQIPGWATWLSVSIHALLAECDTPCPRPARRGRGFNPRTPCGVRQFFLFGSFKSFFVSIHALLAECDNPWDWVRSIMDCFNPRTPCGVRPSCPHQHDSGIMFQSTHSLRSATYSPLMVNC